MVTIMQVICFQSKLYYTKICITTCLLLIVYVNELIYFYTILFTNLSKINDYNQ